MRTRSIALTAALPLLAVAFAVAAQDAPAAPSPVGQWTTIDDATGKARSIVEISRAADGNYSGRVIEVLLSDQGPNPVCDECTGARKDQPIAGMTILWDMQDQGDGEYGDGTILDPSKGRQYAAKLRLIGADKLGVSGCILFICREQVWVRQ